MAQATAVKAPGGQKSQGAALLLVRLSLGIFLLFQGLSKASWLVDSGPLALRLSEWLDQATPASRWYLERILPGAPVFARLVPLGEMMSGLALIAGFWPRLAAGLAFLMVLNFQIADGAIFKYEYLTDAMGLPVLGGLLGLAIGGGRLPLSLRR